MKWFLLFLFALVVIETVVTIFVLQERYNFTMPLYNLLTFLEFNFLLFFYLENSESRITRRIIILGMIFFNIILISSSLYLGQEIFDKKFNHISAISGGVIISVLLILHLREFLLSEKILNYKKNIFFWIATGLLIYYLGSLPITAVVNIWISGNQFFSYKLIIIQHLLTTIMHVCFISGLLWSYKKMTYY